jgi:hypothetical protein
LIAFGSTGIWAASRAFTNLPTSIQWSRWVFSVMGVGTILGLFYQTNTLGGYLPLFSGNIALHAVGALFGAYFGFVLPARAAKEISQRFPDSQRRAS